MKNGGCSLSNGKMSGAKVRKGTNYWLSEGQAVRKARLYVRDMVRQKCFKEVTSDTSLLFCNLHCVFLMGCSQSARQLFPPWADMGDWWGSCFFRRLTAVFCLSKAHKTGLGVWECKSIYITFLYSSPVTGEVTCDYTM